MRNTFKYNRKELKYQNASSFDHGDMVHVGKYLIHIWYKVHNGKTLKGTQMLHSTVEDLQTFNFLDCTPGTHGGFPYYIYDFLPR